MKKLTLVMLLVFVASVEARSYYNCGCATKKKETGKTNIAFCFDSSSEQECHSQCRFLFKRDGFFETTYMNDLLALYQDKACSRR
ncbi:MAG: hypothetical protein JAZ19_03825 [Candidatus Thiodiazotropha taylori]|nr:hypothetical protein [Candidatus Thiodiazotropha taylori]